jgi:glycosyltransferase involved in cell wall biosynthesis
MRLAWFSPMPPVPSGIATCSAELVRELGKRHTIDVYVHTSASTSTNSVSETRVRSAHDFVWRNQRQPYDLTVYQVGNSSHHDYVWPYLFRYPGLTVLHDAHLHHARAAALLRTKRPADFRAEFAANHPNVSVDLAELAVAGFDTHMYYQWPMSRLVIEASRLTAVHTRPLMSLLKEDLPGTRLTSIRLAHGTLVSDEQARRLRSRVRATYGIPEHAVVFGVFGGVTPDKRVPQILDALDAIVPYAPTARLLLAGSAPRHYDVGADVRRRGLENRVTLTGYLPDEADLTACIAASDISLNLRWPTAREMSGPWLRALAAGRPTITIDLAHMVDVPSLDPRTWRVQPGSGVRGPGSVGPGSRGPTNATTGDLSDPGSRIPDPDAVTVAVDILDEDHSLRLAMRRLATDPALRASLGGAGRRYWEREHSMPCMLEDYDRVLAEASATPPPRPTLPSHLINDGDRVLNDTLAQFSLGPVWATSE